MEQAFRAWLPPPDWLVRPRKPDFFIDYVVEVVENGEPTAKHFCAQVKGRTAKLKGGKLKESFATKHLQYYALCEQPVFIFRIDPVSKAGNWLFIQRYLKQNEVADKLAKQANLTIVFDPSQDLENQELFVKELAEAFKFMSDEFPGSPSAAAAAHKKKLEAIDPNVEVSVEATEKTTNVSIHPKEGAHVISANFSSEVLQALQSGQVVSVKASEVRSNMPIVQHILAEAGDAEITLTPDIPKMSGSAQISVEGEETSSVLHINGEWTPAPLRLRFEGALPEAPFHLESTWNRSDSPDLGNPQVTLGFKFSVWAGQPLQFLAHFDDLKKLFEGRPLMIKLLVRGREAYRGRVEVADFTPDRFLTQSLNWIDKLRHTSVLLGQNPPFPSEDRLADLDTPDARFLVQLATTGKWERSFAGETFEMAGEISQKLEPSEKEVGSFSLFNQYENVNFLGNLVKVGPLSHTWTGIHLLEAIGLPDGRQCLKWKGSEASRFAIEKQVSAT